MSVLIVSKEERRALEAEFEKMIKAGTLPGGVRLGTPIEAEDKRLAFVDARWDAKELEADSLSAIQKRIATMQTDAKVVITTATRVVAAVPKDFVIKSGATMAPVEVKK